MAWGIYPQQYARILLMVANLLLTRLGFDVQIAENGKNAIDTIKQYPDKFDLILMDIQMPIMDGITATQKIKSLNPNQIIVALSANAKYEYDYQSYKFDDFISKPINLGRIKDVTDRFLAA